MYVKRPQVEEKFGVAAVNPYISENMWFGSRRTDQPELTLGKKKKVMLQE